PPVPPLLPYHTPTTTTTTPATLTTPTTTTPATLTYHHPTTPTTLPTPTTTPATLTTLTTTTPATHIISATTHTTQGRRFRSPMDVGVMVEAISGCRSDGVESGSPASNLKTRVFGCPVFGEEEKVEALQALDEKQ
ncbi:hypothetical protein Hamer_G011629, partial [Homarus americanus]